MRVAHPDQHVIRHTDQRIGPVDLFQRIDKSTGDIRLVRAGHKMDKHLCIR